MEEAKKYLQEIGLENVIGEEFFNDDDKSWYKVEELMESYYQAKLKLLGIPDVEGQSEQLPCKHKHIESSDGCDECMDCGARNY